jgi:hypothetical protein
LLTHLFSNFKLIVNVDGSSQFVNVGIDFDLFGDGQLYFGASHLNNQNYFVGELRAVSNYKALSYCCLKIFNI